MRWLIWAGVLVMLLASPVWAKSNAGVIQTSTAPHSDTQVYTLDIGGDTTELTFAYAVNLSDGIVTIRILDPQGKVLASHGGRVFTVGPGIIKDISGPGRYQVEVVSDKAVGRWQASVAPLLPRRFFPFHVAGSIAMLFVALASVAWWRLRFGGGWRWVWAGAAMWVVGVALKFAWAAITINATLKWMESRLSRDMYVLLGGVYTGLLTGVFEIGVVAAAALIWRRLASDASRAVAIGVGAGAFEAALLGAAAAGSGVVVLLNVPQARESVAPVMSLMLATTPLAWLVGPVERAITIPCHVSSRVLALLGVARGKWTPFWIGFAMITLVDVVAGVAHVSGRLGMFSIWWLELAILPFAILSLPLTVWAARKWPLTNAGRAPDCPAQLLLVGPSNP